MNNDAVKKAVYDNLATKVNAIVIKIPSTSGMLTEKQYESEKQGFEKKIEVVDRKIPNISGLVKKTDYYTMIAEIENKIPSVTCLVTTATLNIKGARIEHKIPDTTNLASKASLNTKATEVENSWLQRLPQGYHINWKQNTLCQSFHYSSSVQ